MCNLLNDEDHLKTNVRIQSGTTSEDVSQVWSLSRWALCNLFPNESKTVAQLWEVPTSRCLGALRPFPPARCGQLVCFLQKTLRICVWGPGYFTASIPTVGLLTSKGGARAVSPKENERLLRSLARYRVRSDLPFCFRSPRFNPARGFSGSTQKPQPPPFPSPYVSWGCNLPRISLTPPSCPPPPPLPHRARAPMKPKPKPCAKSGLFSQASPCSLVSHILSKKPIRNTPALSTPRLAPNTAPPWGASSNDPWAQEWDPTSCS